MKAMIFAAGLGTRLKPLTDKMPKALVPIAGKPLLEHIITKLIAAGFDEIIVNVHHFAEQVIDFIRAKNSFGIRIEISDERDELLDTGGGIAKAAWFFDDNQPFLLHNVDILSDINLKELYATHLATGAEATLAVSKRDSSRRLFFDKKMQLRGWLNETSGETKPTHLAINKEWHKLAFAGIQVVSPSLLKGMKAEKFSIIDFYLAKMQQHHISGFCDNGMKMIDVGKLYSLEEANRMFG
jgi:NDP-sugar pyrophosphorylase family protein